MNKRFSLLLVLSVFASSCGDDSSLAGIQAEKVQLQQGGTKTGPCTSSGVQGKTRPDDSTPGAPSSSSSSSVETGSTKTGDPWPVDMICVGRDNGSPCGDYSLCVMQRCMPTYCGDGIIMPYEECEDGNDEINDGCDACIIERCGDGILHPGEECDDGNNIRTDGCNNVCQRTKANLCGNGKVDGKEECDDGNTVNEDECRNDCRKAPAASCGNRKVEEGEECDDGRNQANDGCGPNCKLEVCGDGFVAAFREQCDDGNTIDGDGCSSKCKVEYTVCGNGVVEEGEQCDDGNNRNTDECPNDCLLAVCGDGLLEGPESCDDGNTVAGDGCDASCVQETECGNGVVEFAVGGEHCDDGNDDNFDRCPNDCKRPQCGDGRRGGAVEECDGEDVPQAGQKCDAQCRIQPVCGNGIVELSVHHPDLSELCDDGNTVGGDSCAADCKSTTSAALCGNGQLDPGEECDLGDENDKRTLGGKDDPKRKIGVCRACRWTYFNEACSRCMAKTGLTDEKGCVSWGTRPCNAVFGCYVEEKCSFFYKEGPVSAIAAMGCMCGRVSVSECTSATHLLGACEPVIVDPRHMFSIDEETKARLPMTSTQDKVKHFLQIKHPSGRTNNTFLKMARRCRKQCGSFVLSGPQLEKWEEKTNPKDKSK